ncbi:fumarylacetoacetate hydrolase family protein [Crocosphaera sp. UHCC 0190]|uniref:fumarylacetoacetate hydrolase family protein n=1 Tax=Crocosphaera sp. UHCC 0190 TaxID=3110246 RepID=UPI002B1EAB1A|nr:fumarylacetoacetate hydrolase family protein [Crocosphaera sp. UHCC 0190]MEA5509846.1 fumarylacetoacetate hydrolase family protein [Crocosphaera sp. UHCC 0190]
MAQRYVRVKTTQGNIHYGSLNLNRSVAVFDAAPWEGGQPSGVVLKADTYDFLAPCAPSKIVAVGRNYRAHAAELGNTVPEEPLLFLKPPSTLIGEGQTIYYPVQSQRVDYEGELALIIGETTKDCSPQDARYKIWGYTIANDVTARDLQQKDSQWTRAKGFDSFCPLGPWVIRELSAGAKIQTFINNESEPRQSALVQDMVFSPQALVSYISHIMTLLPGDVVLTGTPEGVGPLQVGDIVRIEIEGIGSLENSIMAVVEPS